MASNLSKRLDRLERLATKDGSYAAVSILKTDVRLMPTCRAISDYVVTNPAAHLNGLTAILPDRE